MPELLEIPQLILKHLPPSADAPNVRPLDEDSRRWCVMLERQHHIVMDENRAVDGIVASDISLVHAATSLLRANGRAIFLVPTTEDVTHESLVRALTSAGLVRILTETVQDNAFWLARGERPTEQMRTTDRIAAIAQVVATPVVVLEVGEATRRYSHLYLLVRQDPPARGWDDLRPGTTWQAVTVREIDTDRVALLAFTSLTKAVAFMQSAVLASIIQNVNKMPRFAKENFGKWGMPLIVNPAFETLHADSRFQVDAPAWQVDPMAAVKSQE